MMYPSEVNVFLFGQAGSGKSTVAAAVSFFFQETKGIVPLTGAVHNPEGARKLVEWVKLLRDGDFPPLTNPGSIIEVTTGFRVIGRNEGVVFRLLEISGEDVTTVSPIHPRHIERTDELDEWVLKADVFLLTACAQPYGDDRYILQAFCEYLDSLNIDKPIALILTEWDLVCERTPVEHANYAYGEVARHVSNRGGELIPFSVGTVNQDSKRIDGTVNFEAGTRQLIEWILGRAED